MAALEYLESCSLCGGRTFTTLTRTKGRVTGHTFGIVECNACGLMFTNPRLDEAANQSMYDEAYYHGEGFDHSVHYEDEQSETEARAGESRGIILKIRALCALAQPRVLDVGCGTGGLLLALTQAGFTSVEGLEFSSYAAGRAAERTGCVVHHGELDELATSGRRYDVINATEVLEHVRDPLKFLSSIEALLSPGGVFIYSTGNARGLYARALGRRWPYLNPEGHLFYYNPNTVGRFLQRAGLEVLEPARLEPETRARLAQAEAEIAHSQLLYIGLAAPGLKGFIFRTAAIAKMNAAKHAVSWVVGKGNLPSGRKRATA